MGAGLIPGQGTKILHAVAWPVKKKKGYSISSLFTVSFFFNDVEFHLYSFAGEIQIQLSHHHLLQILQNVTKITFHNWTVSTSLFNKNWSYSVKQDKQVLHSFAFWGFSTPPPANTHTHTRARARAPENTKCKIPETIYFLHHSELHDEPSHSVLPWMQIIPLSSISHALVTY